MRYVEEGEILYTKIVLQNRYENEYILLIVIDYSCSSY